MKIVTLVDCEKKCDLTKSIFSAKEAISLCHQFAALNKSEAKVHLIFDRIDKTIFPAQNVLNSKISIGYIALLYFIESKISRDVASIEYSCNPGGWFRIHVKNLEKFCKAFEN